MRAIGIDLGTTNSCVAALRNGRIEIIPNLQGKRVTPSWVAFNDTGRLVGEAAKNQASRNSENTLYQIKRLIGRMYDDKTVQEDMKLWNFKVVNDENKPKIEVRYNKAIEKFCPEQVSAEVLSYLKKCAEVYLGTEVKHAVIAVPAYFNDAQRKATMDAGAIAGLNVLEIINEPTAAAIAYGLQRETKTERKILIFDFGGGTFDVTIIKIKDRKYKVMAIGGDSHLGGEDVNAEMFEHLVKSFNSENECDMKTNRRSASRLLAECERVKKELSTSAEENVIVDALFDGIDFTYTLSRSKFEDWNSRFFEQTIDTVRNTLKNVGLKKKRIDDVVLVGGSTRIPKIQELLEEYFEKHLLQNINADEAVAYGAACQAAILNNEIKPNEMYDIDVHDVTPISLGIECNLTCDMVVVAPRNTTIPTKKWHNFTTSVDNQSVVRFSVYEGERPYAKDNHHLGSFLLKNIPPLPRGEANLSVCFDISRSGTLKVTATDVATKNESFIEFSDKRGRLSREDIDEMIRKAEKFKKDDEEHRKRSALINKLEQRVYDVKKMSQNLNKEGHISEVGKQEILDKCSDMMKWIDNNKRDTEMEEIQAKGDELEMAFSGMKTKADMQKREAETTNAN